jgi:hypothetical protein
MTLHKDLTAANNHVVSAFTYADATARGAATVTVSDVGKVAWQQDDDSFWVLKDDSPLTWVALGSGGGGGAVDSVNGQTGTVVLDPDDLDDTATTHKWVSAANLTKLAGIEAGADVTDATNVDAAGAVMNSDTSTAAMSFVIDEDAMTSDLATKVPTQQSVKAYVDAAVIGAGSYTNEQAQDAVGGILTDSSSIDFTYDDAGNSITAAVILEWLQDTVAAMLTGGSHTNLTATYQDATGVVDLAASGGSTENLPKARREMSLLANGGAGGAFAASGLPAPTSTGLRIALVDDSAGPLGEYQTTSSSGNAAGLNGTTGMLGRGLSPEIGILFKTGSDVTSLRYWAGLFFSDPSAINGEPSIAMSAFRYDTGVDGTAFWRCVSDTPGQTSQVTTTSVAVTADTRYSFRIVQSSTDDKFYINGTLVATHSSASIPPAAQLTTYHVRVTTLTAATRSFRLGAIYIRHDG